MTLPMRRCTVPLLLVFRDLVRWPRSDRLDVGCADHFAPFLGVIADELAEIGWGAGEHHAAEPGEPRFHLGIVKGRPYFNIEFLDYRRWRVSGRNEPDPLARFKTRNELAESWNVRQHLRARGSRHRQCTQSTGPDMSERRRHFGERYLNFPANQPGHRGCRATIGNMSKIGARHQSEIFADDMRWRTVAARAHGDFAWIGLGVRDELGNAPNWKRWIHLHELGHEDDACDRSVVPDKVEI